MTSNPLIYLNVKSTINYNNFFPPIYLFLLEFVSGFYKNRNTPGIGQLRSQMKNGKKPNKTKTQPYLILVFWLIIWPDLSGKSLYGFLERLLWYCCSVKHAIYFHLILGWCMLWLNPMCHFKKNTSKAIYLKDQEQKSHPQAIHIHTYVQQSETTVKIRDF